MSGYSVVVVDDHDEVRGVLRALFRQDARFEVVAEALDGRGAIDLALLHQPDILLLDLAMPMMDGLAALPEIRRRAPCSAVVVLSAFGTDRTVHTALSSGAVAFVSKGADLAETLVPTCLSALGVESGLAQPGATVPPPPRTRGRDPAVDAAVGTPAAQASTDIPAMIESGMSKLA